MYLMYEPAYESMYSYKTNKTEIGTLLEPADSIRIVCTCIVGVLLKIFIPVNFDVIHRVLKYVSNHH